MSRFTLRRTIASIVTMLAIASGCSSNSAVQDASETTAASTAARPDVSTTDTPTTVAETTTTIPGTPTTVAEVTTTATDTPTTVAPTASTISTVPAGWTAIDPANSPGPKAYPCCASNWYGVASPPLPSPGAALADGIYAVDLTWPSDFSQSLVATVTRFEQCSALPAGQCEEGGDTYEADELGLDDTDSFALTLAFDNHVRVVLGGFGGWDNPTFAVGNGTDIARLVTALDADYQVAILQPYLSGTTQDDITAALAATPANGFSAPAEPGAGALVYTADGAPPLLFQGLVGFDDTPNDTRGSDIIGRIALVVSGGQMTINLYAGFYS